MYNHLDKFIFNYFDVRKGLCFYNRKNHKRYVVVDYDLWGVWCISLNGHNKFFKKVHYIDLKECEKYNIEKI